MHMGAKCHGLCVVRGQLCGVIAFLPLLDSSTGLHSDYLLMAEWPTEPSVLLYDEGFTMF